MTPILWEKTHTDNSGREWHAYVQQDWMCGHGVFEGRYRWSLVLVNEYKPLFGYGHNLGSLERAIELAEESLEKYTV